MLCKMACKIFPKHITSSACIDLGRKNVVANNKWQFCRGLSDFVFLDMLNYFNNKPCFLMLNFAHYTLCQKKIDTMSRKSIYWNDLLQTNSGDLISKTDISGRNKNVKKV